VRNRFGGWAESGGSSTPGCHPWSQVSSPATGLREPWDAQHDPRDDGGQQIHRRFWDPSRLTLYLSPFNGYNNAPANHARAAASSAGGGAPAPVGGGVAAPATALGS